MGSVKARKEGAEATKAKKTEGLAAAVEKFKRDHPEEWDAIRLTPTQHGVEVIAKKSG